MLRALIWLAGLLLSAGAAWADAGAAPEAMPIELQVLKIGAEVVRTVCMPGVIVGLIYLLKVQRDRQDAEVAKYEAALKEEQAFNRKVQEDRIAAASAGADRLATVAVSSNNAIATAAEKNAGVMALCQEIKEGVGRLGRGGGV